MRQQQKEKTYKAIIKAAISEFENSGINNTSTLDIAKRAGVAHGTIFIHFSSREELVEKAIESELAKLTEPFFKEISGYKNLKSVLQVIISHFEKNKQFFMRVYNEFFTLSEETQGKLTKILKKIYKKVENVILRGQKQSKFRKISVDTIFTMFIASLPFLETVAFKGGQKKNKDDHERLVNYILELVMIRRVGY